jgi:hypothetical protein
MKRFDTSRSTVRPTRKLGAPSALTTRDAQSASSRSRRRRPPRGRSSGTELVDFLEPEIKKERCSRGAGQP